MRSTHVLMTSPSANRVYRSLFEPAVQEVRVSVGPGARLEWLPEVTIPFAGSRFRQSLHVDLAPGATVILWDAMASGRVAKQERWAFASLENEICIRTSLGGSLVERYCMVPGQLPESVGLVGSWDYVASLFVIGDAVDPDIWKRLDRSTRCYSGAASWPGVGSGVHSGSSRFGSQIGRSVCTRTYCDVRGDLGGGSERTMGSSAFRTCEGIEIG